MMQRCLIAASGVFLVVIMIVAGAMLLKNKKIIRWVKRFVNRFKRG
jgi:predicted PurR-regulated permease PerM